jgi:tetratricopeptide (TPR) repeat protein
MDDVGELLDTGLDLEPDYPALLIEKYRYHTHQIFHGVVPEDEARKNRAATMAHLERADPENPAVLISKVGTEKNLATRADLIVRAYRLAPTDPIIVEVVARLARDLGQFDVAIALGDYLVARDPLCGRCFYRLGATYMEAFEPGRAIPHFEKALLLGAGQLDAAYGIGHAHLMNGNLDTALKMFEVALHEVHRQLGFLMAFHDQGRLAEFKELLAEFEQQVGWDQHAFVYAWIGDADKAFELLEAGYAQFPSAYTTLFSDTRLIRIHDDPRWRKLMERIGTTPEQLAAIKLDISAPN